MQRKGFPESYDRRALLRFVVDIKSGMDEVEAPVYDHLTYDVVRDEKVQVKRPDIVIIEGLNVLQPARVRDDGRTGLAVSDFFDFSRLRRRRDLRHPRLVRLSLPPAARDRLPRPAVLLLPLRLALPRRGGRRGDPDLGRHQRAEPRRERPADPLPRDAGAAQGRRPLGPLRPARARSSDPATAGLRAPTSESRSATSLADLGPSAASTITRTSGSVPEGRSSTRPRPPRAAASAATAAARTGIVGAVLVDAGDVDQHLRQPGHHRRQRPQVLPGGAIRSSTCSAVRMPSPVVA